MEKSNNTMTQDTEFLPEHYEAPQGGGSYMKLQKGENRFRILAKPIIGWLDWENNKPLRFMMNNKPAKPIDPKKPIKHFWAVVVWDYADGKVKILEITQATIQRSIQSLYKDSDWGAPYEYDIKITKTGDGMDTEYTTNPAPKKPVSAEAQEAYMAKPVNLNALFTGADPFDVEPISHDDKLGLPF